MGVKPVFSIVSILESKSELLRQPFIYASGTDVTSGSLMKTSAQQVHLASSTFAVFPVGSVLVLYSGTDEGQPGVCQKCPDNTYNVNPLTGRCLPCPSSAVCVHGAPPVFDARKLTGVLEIEISDSSSDEDE